MTNIPPPAEELRILDLELRRLDVRRTQLLQRRAWLLGALQAAAAPAPASPRPVRGPEATPPNVQNVLLTLGGILLTIAAIAFTLVSWGHLGIGGRSAVLAAVTLTALGVPAALLRRKLRSTAETVGALGIALTVLDAYALHAVALPQADGIGYTAAASAVLAALWAAYGLAFRELRLPLPLAMATAQLPLFLWVSAADAGDHATAAALLVTAAFDVAVALRVGDAGVRVVATVGACAAGLWGAVGAGYLSWAATDVPDALRAGALLMLAAAIALVAAWLITQAPQASGAAFAGGLLVAAGAGGMLREALPAAWTVPCYLACAVALLALVRTALPRPVLRGVAGAALLVHALAALWTLPALVSALAGPASWAGKVWSGAPHGMDGAVAVPGLPVEHPLTASLVLAVVAGVLVAASRLLPTATEHFETPTHAAPAPAARPTTPSTEAGTGPGAQRHGEPPLSPTTARGTEPSSEPGEGLDAGPDAGPISGLVAGPGTSPRTGPGEGPDAEPGTGPTAGPGGGRRSVPSPAAAPPTAPHLDNPGIARSGALALAWAAFLILPSALQLPYAAGVSAYIALTAALLAAASRVRSNAVALTSLSLAVASSVSVAFLALATAPATLGTFGALTALSLAVTVFAARRPGTTSGVAVTTACASVAYATALACASGAALDLRADHIGLLMLVVPALSALAAARLGRHPLTLPVEIAGALAGGFAVVLTAEHATTLALALALGGVIAAGTALRTDRRPVGYAAGALFLLATWVRLAAWDVETPEAYTLPITVPALLIGALRRRRVPDTSSWTAYGPGLTATLLPSLIATWGDTHWQRPLLLGTAALLITLVGARHRLQAPLVLGGTVLALDALHELAPYIVQVVDALPRWLPPALAGLLLLAIGATYEQRMRDARRVRDVLGRMH
ncbi:SCO7613 C-terminal domain-containing membrane protein [Streptomyces sp. NPDC056486]|uniref:SCO7613 C-terminal domain-containing membrane protein n=1 Tax=Streptomyces sp. NPDC056486 TaxID=3345835 RepID=UPI00367BD388